MTSISENNVLSFYNINEENTFIKYNSINYGLNIIYDVIVCETNRIHQILNEKDEFEQNQIVENNIIISKKDNPV